MPVGRVAVTVVLMGRGHGDGAAAVDSGPGTVAMAPRALAPPYLLPLGPAVEEPVPDDRYHAIYFAMLLAGVGFLLPYNSFITDVDYLHHKYPGGSPAAAPGPRRGLEPVFPRSSLRCESLRDSGQLLPLSGLSATFRRSEEAAPGEGGCRLWGSP